MNKQTQIEKLIRRLQTSKSEASNIDAKVTLNLKEDGDKATFIRHIAALANTGIDSYLIIGVEDKTWIIKGLPEGSPLREVDSTQQQMNNTLSKRIDPPITVTYRVYYLQEGTVGVVFLKGSTPPHIISIEPSRFGGKKSEGEEKESFIYKGVIYIRRGTESVPVVRQGEIFGILNNKSDYREALVHIGFITYIVAVVVGVGVSLIHFTETLLPSILGILSGILVGYLFNKRLADTFGQYPSGGFTRAIKIIGGPFCGGFMGGLLSYMLVTSMLDGHLKPFDPISMGLVFVPLIAFIFLAATAAIIFAAMTITDAASK